MSGFSYDAAGDTTNDGANTYTWDAEGRLTSAAGVTDTYDGDGQRVAKSSGTLYWQGISGPVIAETNTSGNTLNEYIFLGHFRVARRDSSGNVYYYFANRLGSPKITNATGSTCYDADFYPFGGELAFTNNCSQNYKFAGMQRNPETGKDHTLFRSYESNYGRWLSPNPADLAAADPTNPQSWNRYAYALNNPVTINDPFGLGCSQNWMVSIGEDGTTTLIEPLGPITCDGGPGGSGAANSGQLSPKQQQCLAKVQGLVNADLGLQSIFLGVTQGMDENGMRGGAYNFDFFVPNVPLITPPGSNSVKGVACGRFDDGLHVPVPSFTCNLSGDPTISSWGPGFYNGVEGSFLTAHIDSSNPFQDLYSFFVHLISNVILQKKHGC